MPSSATGPLELGKNRPNRAEREGELRLGLLHGHHLSGWVKPGAADRAGPGSLHSWGAACLGWPSRAASREQAGVRALPPWVAACWPPVVLLARASSGFSVQAHTLR